MARLAAGDLFAAYLVGSDWFRFNKSSSRNKYGSAFEHIDDVSILRMQFAEAGLVAMAGVNHVLVARIEEHCAFLKGRRYFLFLKISDCRRRCFGVHLAILE